MARLAFLEGIAEKLEEQIKVFAFLRIDVPPVIRDRHLTILTKNQRFRKRIEIEHNIVSNLSDLSNQQRQERDKRQEDRKLRRRNKH